MQLNFVGTVLSLLAIVTTCVGQIVSFANSPTHFSTFWANPGWGLTWISPRCMSHFNRSTFLLDIFLSIFLTKWINSADKHNTEKAQCLFHTASLPLSPVSSGYPLCLRPRGGQVPHQTKCLCIQIFSYSLGTY